MASAKRNRDYSAERARRNAEARRWGFSSLDAMSKARKRGEFPTAAELRRDPSSGIRAMMRREDREMQAFDARRRRTPLAPSGDVKRTRQNARAHDIASAEWSKDHSRQKSTRFNPRWSAAKKERYYQTFVRPWGGTRSDEQREAYHEWQSEFADEYIEMDNPYV